MHRSSLIIAAFIAVILIICTINVSASRTSDRLRSKITSQPITPILSSENPFDELPHMSLLDFHDSGNLPGDDAFAQVRSVIGSDDEIAANARAVAENDNGDDATSFVEMGAQVGKVRSYCEICILVMQMKERGQPHLCAGLNTNYHITCIETLESILRADKAIVYWLKNGCMHMDSEGPEIVRPCPAINICSWVPNLFADAPSLVRDGVDSMCPKDPKFLPTIPQEFRNLLGNTDNTAKDTSATDGPVDPSTSGI